MSQSLKDILLWVTVEYVAISFLPAVILLMCLDYTGRNVKRWMYIPLLGIPAATLILHGSKCMHSALAAEKSNFSFSNANFIDGSGPFGPASFKYFFI